MSDAPKLTAQAVGRFGELAAEMALLERGWIPGNFNATTKNTAGFDLFAVKGSRNIKVRVMAKRNGSDSWQRVAKPDGSILKNLDPDDKTDFTILISFDHTPRGHTAYVMPSQVFEATMKDQFERYCEQSPTMRNGQPRTAATHKHRAIWLDSPTRGFASEWEGYCEAWDQLEAKV